MSELLGASQMNIFDTRMSLTFSLPSIDIEISDRDGWLTPLRLKILIARSRDVFADDLGLLRKASLPLPLLLAGGGTVEENELNCKGAVAGVGCSGYVSDAPTEILNGKRIEACWFVGSGSFP